jgi:hypothetical protein
MVLLVLEEFPDARVVLRRTTNGRFVMHRADVPDKTLCGLDGEQKALMLTAGKTIHLCRKCADAVDGKARIERLT